MERSQSNTVNMKLEKETIDTSAIANKSSFEDYSHHRRYSESALDSKSQEGSEEKKQRLYKTEICRNWEEQNACRYGIKCQYAHGKDELRFVKRHPRYKTIYCQTFETLGGCPYGIRCTFLHESSPHDLQSSLDSLKSDLPVTSSTPTSESTSHPAVSDNQVPPSSTPTVATDYSPWNPSRLITQPPTQYGKDNTTSSPHPPQTSALAQQSTISPAALLPRLSISSSSSSSSSIISASSSAIFSPLSQQQQGIWNLNIFQDHQQKRLAGIDDYPKQIHHWHQPYFENHFSHQQQEQAHRTQKYQLPGSRSTQDLFTDGDGFHSALGVAPPSTPSTPTTPSTPSIVTPPSSFFSRRPPPNLPTCTSSSTSFSNYKYRLIN